MVLESSDRDASAPARQRVRSLREPVATAVPEFHLTPYAGVAVLGRMPPRPSMLLITRARRH